MNNEFGRLFGIDEVITDKFLTDESRNKLSRLMGDGQWDDLKLELDRYKYTNLWPSLQNEILEMLVRHDSVEGMQIWLEKFWGNRKDDYRLAFENALGCGQNFWRGDQVLKYLIKMSEQSEAAGEGGLLPENILDAFCDCLANKCFDTARGFINTGLSQRIRSWMVNTVIVHLARYCGLDELKYYVELDGVQVSQEKLNTAFRFAALEYEGEVVKYLLTLKDPAVDLNEFSEGDFRSVIHSLMDLKDQLPLEEVSALEVVVGWICEKGTSYHRSLITPMLNSGPEIDFNKAIESYRSLLGVSIATGNESAGPNILEEVNQEIEVEEAKNEVTEDSKLVVKSEVANNSKILVKSAAAIGSSTVESKVKDITKKETQVSWIERVVVGAMLAGGVYFGLPVVASKLAYAVLLHAAAPVAGAVVAFAVGALTARFVKSGLVSVSNAVKSLFGYTESTLKAAAQNKPKTSEPEKVAPSAIVTASKASSPAKGFSVEGNDSVSTMQQSAFVLRK